jgi:GT2 family glycosyltransferase
MQLSIIIVNYNTGALTKALLESMLSTGLPDETEIIVVDNDSRDDSVPLLRSDFPEITVIANQANLGLAAGVNMGMRQAQGKYYLILNPDMIVLPHALQNLLAYMEEHPSVGMAGGKLIFPNGKIQYSCYRFYRPMTIIYRRTWLGRTRRGQAETARFLMKEYDHLAPREVEWLMGACLMVRADAVKEVGGMDERFFLYFEDVDWCRRFWLAGWRVVYVPSAVFSHYHQRSSKRGSWLGLLFNPIAQQHVLSAIKYFLKYRNAPTPSPTS